MRPGGSVVRYGLTVAAVYGAWKLAALGSSSALAPDPETVVAAFLAALGEGEFWRHFGASAFRAGSAMLIAWAAGFPLGVLMGGSVRADRILSPFLFLTYPIPKIVLLPVVLLVFGLGDISKVAILSLILGYQVVVTTRDGVRGIHPKHLDSVRSLGASRLQQATEALIPAGLPYGFTALRLNAGVSVAVLFFVESFGTQRGLGYLIMDAWTRMAFNEMFTGILGMSLLGVLLHETANLLEKRLCVWRTES